MGGQKKPPLYKSFGYAFEGIFAVIRKERNMKMKENAIILPPGTPLTFSPFELIDTLILFTTLQMANKKVTKNMPYISHISPSVQ